MVQQFRIITLAAAWLVILLSGIYFLLVRYDQKQTDKVRIGVRLSDDHQRGVAQQFFGDQYDLSRANYVEFTAGWKEFFALQQAGLQPELVVDIQVTKLFDQGFHRLDQIDSVLQHLNQAYPSITTLHTIGSSAFWGLPIRAIRISSQPINREGTPSLLLTAAHHGNEPIGVEICLHVMNYLCRNSSNDPKVKTWLEKSEVWIVPVINPDGYRLNFSDSARLIWRKNMRDNNGDGRFSPESDGVDLNRNYDYHWDVRGDHSPQSSYYCGSAPFSEPEIVAIRHLAEHRRFSLHLDFHSAGEKVLYPTEIAVTHQLADLAEAIARQIKKSSGSDHYQVAPLHDWVGQCSSWMFHQMSVPSLLIEAGDSFFPNKADLLAIIEQNAQAVFYSLDLLTGDNTCPTQTPWLNRFAE
ncbi:MAG: M14 family zinc carboxypeptidase [candidate division KSB1 bacterium]|nr:M14 family zinc carboxypeptidase [candidate division KSB1 bacterium]MDZ7335786.1 M14 family zinc carboxypeptidase [candidate division KSB1 bacterium]MDZ7359095.1 M14 family zinc carboxypeptidase [candidate division KSB1 bacterium]MDZ7400773.1 M14 family zinc carboxypeptidase [candidate division KSB1 bacterium]